MITSIIHCNDNITASAVKHILTNLKYDNLKRGLDRYSNDPHREHYIVLFEYVHSGVDAPIAEVERIPGTVRPIHDFLLTRQNILRSLFASMPEMKLYTRRKTEGALHLITKYRQLVLYIPAEPPSPVYFNPEDDDYDLLANV